MSNTVPETVLGRPPQPAVVSAKPSGGTARPTSVSTRYGDKIYSALTFLASLSIFVIIIWLAISLAQASGLSIHKFGWHFVNGHVWDETTDTYGILPFIFGTLYSSLIALILAVPVSIGAAVFLSELAPSWIRTPMTFLIELLAAIPSVVYGLWGIFVLLPWMKVHIMQPAHISINSQSSVAYSVVWRSDQACSPPVSSSRSWSRHSSRR